MTVEPQEKRSHHKITFTGRLHVIIYRATLDVPRELSQFVAGLLLAERRRRGHTTRQPGAGLLLADGARTAVIPRPNHRRGARP
jgi:hypothetical protein